MLVCAFSRDAHVRCPNPDPSTVGVSFGTDVNNGTPLMPRTDKSDEDGI